MSDSVQLPADTSAVQAFVPSLTVTLPVCVPAVAEPTVHETATGWPWIDGSGESDVIDTVVAGRVTV